MSPELQLYGDFDGGSVVQKLLSATIVAFVGLINVACATSPNGRAQLETSNMKMKSQGVTGGSPANAGQVGGRQLVRVGADLILSVPPQYKRSWLQQSPPKQTPGTEIKQIEFLDFEFFLPKFSAYTPENERDEFVEDRVDVVRVMAADPAEMNLDAPGAYPPNMIRRVFGVSPVRYDKRFGLDCYAQEYDVRPAELTCFGVREAGPHEYMYLEVYIPPYAPTTKFPTMQAQYFTPKYGGLTVIWRTHAKNFSHWKEIDQQLWKFIADWSAAGDGGTAFVERKDTIGH